MKKSDYPETVAYRAEYTASDLAALMGVSHRTACKLMDSGTVPSRRNPVGRKERLVRHETIANLSKSGGLFGGILGRITNIPAE